MRDWCESAGLSFYRPPQDFCPYPLLYIHIDHGVSTTERSFALGSASSARPHTCDRHVLSFGPRRKRRDSGGRMLWEHPLPSQSSTRLATDATTHPAPTVPSFLGPDAHTYQNICEYTRRGGTARTCAHIVACVCRQPCSGRHLRTPIWTRTPHRAPPSRLSLGLTHTRAERDWWRVQGEYGTRACTEHGRPLT